MAERVWITADTHFGEPEAVAMFGRPFADAAAMDDALLEGINASVKRDDVLIHLGDFCGPHADGKKAQLSHACAVRKRIRCKKIRLVRGNHDGRSERFYQLFESINDLLSWRSGEDRLRVNASHWPMRLWRGQFKGAVLLHAHAHGGLPMLGRSVDVGVDCWQWKPIELDPLLKWMTRIECNAPDGWPRLQRDRNPAALPDLAS